ncbi:MAG: hypothetical protein H7Z14_04045 [Anaerolineae bacterium]|nr:hypothetical protein [Phycisphaerae bacterium]
MPVISASKSSKLTTILGQPSWRIATPLVEAFVTRAGGHMAPVAFKLNGRKITPYSVAPWALEKSVQRDPKTPAIIKVLRGDFFCMPFGGNGAPFGRERYPVHGEVANANWKFEGIEKNDGPELRLSLATKVRQARVDKTISLRRGHHAIYSRHVISGATGPTTIGHHAMLKFPDEPGSGVISTSRIVYGQVFPEPVERPEDRGYSMLKPGAEFDSLSRVETVAGETTDLSRYPARRGYEDLVMMASDASAPFAWTAVAFAKQRYVWFALKDPRVLRSTILWISNGGRHYAPWSGRHVNVMGLEEVTANFHYGLAESVADNPRRRRGIETHVELDANRPTVVNYIMAIAEIPERFDRVESIEPAGNNDAVEIRSSNGEIIRTSIDIQFLGGGMK